VEILTKNSEECFTVFQQSEKQKGLTTYNTFRKEAIEAYFKRSPGYDNNLLFGHQCYPSLQMLPSPKLILDKSRTRDFHVSQRKTIANGNIVFTLI
jgi:hypothetical protein